MERLILIVDDDENDRVLLERTLRKLGVANPIRHFGDRKLLPGLGQFFCGI